MCGWQRPDPDVTRTTLRPGEERVTEVDGLRIVWDCDAMFPLSGDRWFNAFTMDSYAARAQFEDGYRVVVCLWPSAARRPPEDYAERVAVRMRELRAADEHIGLLDAPKAPRPIPERHSDLYDPPPSVRVGTVRYDPDDVPAPYEL